MKQDYKANLETYDYRFKTIESRGLMTDKRLEESRDIIFENKKKLDTSVSEVDRAVNSNKSF